MRPDSYDDKPSTPPSPGSEGIEPCPWCGHDAEVITEGFTDEDGCHHETGFYVACTACDARGAGRRRRAQVVEAWNRVASRSASASVAAERAVDDCIRELREENPEKWKYAAQYLENDKAAIIAAATAKETGVWRD